MISLTLSQVRLSVGGSCARYFQKLLTSSTLRVRLMSSNTARTAALALRYSIGPIALIIGSSCPARTRQNATMRRRETGLGRAARNATLAVLVRLIRLSRRSAEPLPAAARPPGEVFVFSKGAVLPAANCSERDNDRSPLARFNRRHRGPLGRGRLSHRPLARHSALSGAAHGPADLPRRRGWRRQDRDRQGFVVDAGPPPDPAAMLRGPRYRRRGL